MAQKVTRTAFVAADGKEFHDELDADTHDLMLRVRGFLQQNVAPVHGSPNMIDVTTLARTIVLDSNNFAEEFFKVRAVANRISKKREITKARGATVRVALR